MTPTRTIDDVAQWRGDEPALGCAGGELHGAGDIMFGVGGKMGPTLAGMPKRAELRGV